MQQLKREIEIKNLGPVQHALVDLNKSFQVYIGAQASGKSTICKAIYFCEKIRDYSLTFLVEEAQVMYDTAGKPWGHYMNYLKKQFMGCFGKTTHMKPFELSYSFGEHVIVITLQDGFVQFDFSKTLLDGMRALVRDAYGMQRSINDANDNFTIFDKLNKYQMMKQQFQKEVARLFANNREILYIPAGRSLLATLSEQLQDYSVTEMDLTMQEFINLIRRSKKQFGNKVPEMIAEYVKTVNHQINKDAVQTAYELMKKILKADYTSDSEGEKMYFDEYHWVKLMYSSSGQQEVLWILMLLFVFILQKKRAFVVIEEPEAHLFPIAQKDVVQFIALMKNVTDSCVLITTHSPYILASTNILLYSDKVEKGTDSNIIPMNMRLSGDTFAAYKMVYDPLRGSEIVSIYDEEEALIDTEYIDEVSCITNREFDRLIGVSVANDMQ